MEISKSLERKVEKWKIDNNSSDFYDGLIEIGYKPVQALMLKTQHEAFIQDIYTRAYIPLINDKGWRKI